MPYCFIWASFVLRGIDSSITSWTNASVESFIGTRKRKEKSFLELMPAQYVNYSYGIAKGGCVNYEASQKKKKKNTKAYIVDEELPSQAVGIWNKTKPKAEVVTTIQRKTVHQGYYQSSQILKPLMQIKTMKNNNQGNLS